MANPEKPEDDDEQLVAKEMFDATYEHVDVVKGPAHGMRFVVLKAGEKQDPAAIAALTSSTPKSAATGSPLEVTPVSKETLETQTAPSPVTKAEDLDPTEVLAEPAKGTEGDAEEPGSPAWEAVDAATARKWTAILARAKYALGVMADRENLEVAVGESDDVDTAWNMEDASCAIDYAISVLAPFAVDEQSEADTASEQLGAVAKAMKTASTDDLDVIESLGPVKKAGRVLSSSNEAAIRGAVDSLQKVLASLPAAPEDVTKSKEVIVKVEPIQLVKKAKGDPMVPLYDANGKLCGMVDAEDVVPIAAAPGADQEPAPAPAENPDAPPPDASAAGETTEPATPVAASAAPNAAPAEDEAANQAVAKSQSSQNIAELVQSAVDTAVKAESEEHQKVIKDLKARLEIVERQPASGGPLLGGLALGGLTPTSGGHLALRGQEPENDSPEIVRIKKALEGTKDPVQQAQLSRELSFHQMRERLGGRPK
jgi:hypothetical protein